MNGIISIASQIPISDRGWLAAGRDAMCRRGPDDAGEWWSVEGCVGLGHRRLSVIDSSPAGHQPMQDANGELCIVFKGKIYNFADLRPECRFMVHDSRGVGWLVRCRPLDVPESLRRVTTPEHDALRLHAQKVAGENP